jgi:prepilin-type N-terminal cleavage/methylation domain-containing protein
MKKDRGFTLIELLVVIAIIGILASVILASLNTARAKARDARRVEDLGQIQVALEYYYDANGSYPIGGAGSDRPCWVNNDPSDFGCNPLGPLVVAKYLPALPHDPGINTYTTFSNTGCGVAQFYHYWSDGQRYLLGAVQESKGTTGCQTGDWMGPTDTLYPVQYYVRQGV